MKCHSSKGRLLNQIDKKQRTTNAFKLCVISGTGLGTILNCLCNDMFMNVTTSEIIPVAVTVTFLDEWVEKLCGGLQTQNLNVNHCKSYVSSHTVFNC
jgi:hypothetical protein